ncbi:hypothetical protein ACIA5E_00500 [Nocardia asteroides]
MIELLFRSALGAPHFIELAGDGLGAVGVIPQRLRALHIIEATRTWSG